MATKSTWRLIDSGYQPGPVNMAVDEALLRAYRPGQSVPILRLYGWDPGTISIGYFQKIDEVLNREACRKNNFPYVRRMTGGGLIYHDREITYSLIVPRSFLSQCQDVGASYRLLSSFLIRTYRRLGLEAFFAAETDSDTMRLGQGHPLCFAGRERFDIIIDKHKIGGNAQRRLSGALIQHGSIPLEIRQNFIRPVVNSALGTEKIVSLKDLLPKTPSPDELKRLLIQSSREVFDIDFSESVLSETEEDLTGILLREKYSNRSWNDERVFNENLLDYSRAEE